MQSGPTVLVGHSYGGAVITGAATGAPNVKALVYITAFGLDEGESLAITEQARPALAGLRGDRGPTIMAISGSIAMAFHEAFAADATATEAAVMAAVQKPLSLASFGGSSGVPSLEDHPVLVSGLHRRPHDPAAGAGVPGRPHGRHGPVRGVEPRTLHVAAAGGRRHHCRGSGSQFPRTPGRLADCRHSET